MAATTARRPGGARMPPGTGRSRRMRRPVPGRRAPLPRHPGHAADHPGSGATSPRPGRSWPRAWAASTRCLDEAVLLCSELVTNAVLHTDSGQPGGTVTIVLLSRATCPGRGNRPRLAQHPRGQGRGARARRAWAVPGRAARRQLGLRPVTSSPPRCGSGSPADPAGHRPPSPMRSCAAPGGGRPVRTGGVSGRRPGAVSAGRACGASGPPLPQPQRHAQRAALETELLAQPPLDEAAVAGLQETRW